MWRYLVPVGAVLALPIYLATRAELAETGSYNGIGTSGTYEDESVIHELDTITGMNDAHALVGRRVDLHVPIQQPVNDVAFWVGSSDNRLLVVLAGGAGDATARQKGTPLTDGLHAEPGGEPATISGTVRALTADEMLSWGLTDADRADLLERQIFVRAETVTPHDAD